MHRRDYLILAALVAIAILCVLAIPHLVQLSGVVLAAGEAGELDLQSAYPGPGPYPMNIADGPNLLPLIFFSGN